MFTVVELIVDGDRPMQIFFAVLADIIFFGSLYWSTRRMIAERRKERKEE